jgi:hypothetical protein
VKAAPAKAAPLKKEARQEWLTETCWSGRNRNFLPSEGLIPAFSAWQHKRSLRIKPLMHLNFHRWHGFCTSKRASDAICGLGERQKRLSKVPADRRLPA